ASSGGWIDTNLVPLRRFIATAMDLTMVSATERDRELVADLAAERRCLGKAQMMGISGTAAADKARLLCPRSVRADECPGHPILVVSPFAAGTTYDTVARTVLDPAAAQLGRTFVLENRPGGGGTAAVASVVKAAPDGYTMLLTTSATTAAVILHKSLPYDIVRDFASVAMFAIEPSMLMAAPGKGYNSVADLVAAAKASPGAIKFGSVGVGSAFYIAGERFKQLAGLPVGHVAYSGAAEALADLAAGRIDFYFMPVTPALPLIVAGRGIAIAVSTPDRLQ